MIPKIVSRLAARHVRLAATCLSLALALSAASAATINVSSSAQLSTALSSVNPGDEVVLANANYSGFTVSRSGTASSPILIRAANLGGAVVNSGVIKFNGTSFVTVQGLRITTSGSSISTDGETYRAAVWFQGSTSCRLTRSTLRLSGHSSGTHWVLLGGKGDANRIDHCEFGSNSVEGHYVWPRGNRNIPGVTPPSDRTSWANGNGPVNPNIPLRTQIDHNYFHDQSSGASEVIVLGGLGTTGDYQNYGSVVESNLFVNCNGDAEIISIKSSSNILRYNTIRTSAGMLSARAGNKNSFIGNFMFQNGLGGYGGIKIFEKDHVIYNNYIEGASEYPILIGSGDSYTGSFTHAQVFRARVVHNTLVNVNNHGYASGYGTHTLAPTDCVFANNIIVGSAAKLVEHNRAPVNMTYSNNIAFPTGSGSLGISATSAQFSLVNPQLALSGGLQKLTAGSPAINSANASFYPMVTQDADGQPRSIPDIGADEFSSAAIVTRPLTTADVGPNSPDDSGMLPQVAAPTFSPAPGTYSSCQSVAISSATSGASVRYTTDGSDPRSDLGTPVTGPIVACNTTIKAIAFKSGMRDSEIVTATYVISTGGPTLNFEAESLTRTTSGVSATNDNDANASGGVRVTLNATNTGSWMQFALPNVPAGTYSVRLAYKSNNNRGTAAFQMDGAAFGSPVDQYAASATYPTVTLGTITFASPGDHTFRMTVPSKNSASSSFTLSADKIILVGQ